MSGLPAGIRVFGVRHHGPGCARSLEAALTAMEPDIVLVEGPPEGDALIPLVAHPDMAPPVALLTWVVDQPRMASFYPLAVYSPEWRALRYAARKGIPARFIDLPQAMQFANTEIGPAAESSVPETGDAPDAVPDEADTARLLRADPLLWMARAAGFGDGERWWEQLVEQRQDTSEMFPAILEVMRELRTAVDALPVSGPEQQAELECEERREAHMRQMIRAALKEGFQRIAVVCGAWHAPALENLPPASRDTATLRGQTRVRVEATWIPWTYKRLAIESGYGAGIHSPGYYDHLWRFPDEVPIRWMAQVAALLRAADLDASSAGVIEAVRLAEALAAIRDLPVPGLEEMLEAATAVLCFGNVTPLKLIRDELIVGRQFGRVPDDAPTVPLQQDLARILRRLRMPPEAVHRDYDLDLRKPNDLQRSVVLHRLHLLGVPWGELRNSRGLGTFRESWRLQWSPELALAVIRAGSYGNTLESAATECAREQAEKAPDLPTLTHLTDQVLLADLPLAIDTLMSSLETRAALTGDVGHMLAALPALAQMLRYPGVRPTDHDLLQRVTAGLAARVCVGLPAACSSLDDDAAATMFRAIAEAHGAFQLLRDDAQLSAWLAALTHTADQNGIHGLVGGRCCWLAYDSGGIRADEMALRLSRGLSAAGDAAAAGAWVDGFLRGNGQILIHADSLFPVLDGWLTDLPEGRFVELLPLVRRTFASFEVGERRLIGERVRRGITATQPADASGVDLDEARAGLVLPILRILLGVAAPAEEAA